MRLTDYWSDLLTRTLEDRDDLDHEVWIFTESREPVMMVAVFRTDLGVYAATAVTNFTRTGDVEEMIEVIHGLVSDVDHLAGVTRRNDRPVAATS